MTAYSDINKLKANHEDAAFLTACGRSPEEISSRVNLAVSTIQQLRQSALFRALVEKHRRELRESTAQNWAEKFEALMPKAIQVYEEKMGSLDEGICLRAADAISDRVVPKKTQTQATNEIKVVIENHERAHIESVLLEADEVIEAPEDEVEHELPTLNVSMRPLNEIIEELELEESNGHS